MTTLEDFGGTAVKPCPSQVLRPVSFLPSLRDSLVLKLPRTCVLGCNIPPLRGCAASLSAPQWTSRSKAEVRIRAGFSAVPLGLMTNWRAQVGGRGRPPHTGITLASAPPLKAPPADHAQSDSSYRPHRPRRTPGRRSSRNRCRTCLKSRRPSRRAGRLHSNLFAGELWCALLIRCRQFDCDKRASCLHSLSAQSRS